MPVAYVVLAHALGGFLSGILVTANHYQEMQPSDPKQQQIMPSTYYGRQIAHSAGFAPSSALSFYYGSLDDHPEHHCFPRASPDTLAEIAPRVKAAVGAAAMVAAQTPENVAIRYSRDSLLATHAHLFRRLRSVKNKIKKL